MAHWIVDDHGFGGVYYRCSACRKSWCNIYSDVSSSNETCPECGAPMDEDATEYVEAKKKPFTTSSNFIRSITKNSEALRVYDEGKQHIKTTDWIRYRKTHRVI